MFDFETLYMPLLCALLALVLPYFYIVYWRVCLQMTEVTETRAMVEELLFLLAKIEHQLLQNSGQTSSSSSSSSRNR